MTDSAAIDWTRIESFIGFGSPNAAVVFVGMEEGLLNDADLLEDLRSRSKYGVYEDLESAQATLGTVSKYFGSRAVTQRTWRPMCDLMLRREGVARPTALQRTRYQAERLGRENGESLLTELMPYPCHDRNSWPYAAISPYKNRFEYMAAVRPKRIALLKQTLKQISPEVVVCYGRDDWKYFERLFDGARWKDEYPFRVASLGITRVVLSPHFSSRAFNTDAQLDKFADVALTQAPETEAL